MKERDEFLKRILSAFKIEAAEIVTTMTSGLLELEKSISEERKLELQELIYRQAHTLKGASRAVDIYEVEAICQEQESVFSVLKSGEAKLNADGIDILHKSVDTISKSLSANIDDDSSVKYDVNGTIIQLQNLLIALKQTKSQGDNTTKQDKITVSDTDIRQDNGSDAPAETSGDFAILGDEISGISESDTIRVSTERLDKLLMQLEELLSVKLSSTQMKQQLQKMINYFQAWEGGVKNVYPSVTVLRKSLQKKAIDGRSDEDKALQKTLRFLNWGNKLAAKTESELSGLLRFWEQESSGISIQIDSLLNDVKKIMTVPFSEILGLFPKIVRDLSRQNGKKVKLIIRGEAIEIDRRILERLKNPLIHLLRNCLDHGIEKPAVRKRKNKDEMGVIRINLERSESKRIRFTIEDDGAGINLKKLKLEVEKQEKSTGKDLESSEKLIQYIFKSGISTSDMITDLSGRGLGLAILKRSIDDLGGTIEVDTKEGEGTRFTIELPVSLVTFRGILVRAGEGEYVIPTTKIDRVLFVRDDEVKTIENKTIIYYDRELVPLANLSNILEQNINEKKADHYLVILINDEDRQVAIKIDGLEAEQEILVKSFNSHLKRIRNIAGATILGSGKVVPILNPADLVNTVFKNMDLLERKEQKLSVENRHKILVVEDSITSRMLMKNILERSGYEVETAYDGVDGYQKVVEGGIDLIISDVDMPRMNGFDMTAQIRAKNEISNIPVIIVTSLSSREDLKKGKEVGANGYIIKSNFAQSNLVEIIEKLIKEKPTK